MTALKAALNIDPNPAKDGGDLALASGVALLPSSGPDGTLADIAAAAPSNQVSVYVVRNGDTLGKIAEMFGVSTNTILWANNLESSRDIHPGDTLVILPVSGIQHIVLKGETLAGIVKKYKGDMQDVLDFNHLSAGAELAVGDTVVIPGGIDPAQQTAAPSPSASSYSGYSVTVSASGHQGGIPVGARGTEYLVPGAGGPAIPGYFAWPLPANKGIKTQGLHGYNAIDIGTPVGTPVLASASGAVIVSRSSGYNGGYGEYVVIQHPNGTQTTYAHLSKPLVSDGDQVTQGQTIALSGNTGRSTGPHLHFEVRGAENPF